VVTKKSKLDLKTKTSREIDSTRSRIMRAVKSKDTKPEVLVRQMLHARGFRYRLHRRDLPGSPDLVFPGRMKVVFVNGCFWHGHSCKRGSRVPKNNLEYWQGKIAKNVARDQAVKAELALLGWASHTVWECELHKSRISEAFATLQRFLDSGLNRRSGPVI